MAEKVIMAQIIVFRHYKHRNFPTNARNRQPQKTLETTNPKTKHTNHTKDQRLIP